MKKRVITQDSNGNIIKKVIELTVEQIAKKRAAKIVGFKRQALANLERKFNQLYFAPVATQDKDGNACEIQFRGIQDQVNINSVESACSLLVKSDPNALVTFRTLDNKNRQFRADTFPLIGASMLAAKQGILHTYWARKDALKSLDPTEANSDELESYDANAGW